MENPTSDEKILAALAHASVILTFFGPVGPAAIWAFQRGKSKYVRFHALQAMGFQAYLFWLWMIGMFLFFFVLFGLLIVVEFTFADQANKTAMISPFIIQPIFFLFIFGSWGIFFLGGFLGALFCMLNRDFRYPIIGSWLKKKLLDSQTTDAEFEKWEENWVSGICHSTVILRFWGIATPLTLWLLQKDNSAKIRFQALQAALYQLLAIAASIVTTMVGMAVYILFIVFLAIGVNSASPATDGEMPVWLGAISIMFIGVFMLYGLVSFVIVPVYYLMALIGSFRIINGHEFHYPILGDLIAKRMKPAQPEVIQP